MTPQQSHVTGPVDRFFLRNGIACGYVLDFEGPAPTFKALTQRVLRRAASNTPLRSLPPPPGRYRWTLRQKPLREDVHVHHVVCSDTEDAMTAAITTLLGQQLPEPPHPPWDLWLLHAPGGHRFRIVYRVHHALQDGVGAAHAVLALLSDRPTPGPRPHPAALPTAVGSLLAGQSSLAALRPGKGWTELRSAPTQQTHWTYADAPESHLSELARRHSVTVNDVCLAGLAGALGRWHRTLSRTPHPVPELPVLVPMSFRQEHERFAAGSFTTAHRVVLPCHLADLEQAVRHVHGQTRALRTHRVRDASRLALRLLPTAWGHRVAGAGIGETAAPMFASSITLPHDFTCLDRPVRAASLICDLYGGRLAYISFVRAAGVVRCGLVHDDALPRAASIPGLWRQAVGACTGTSEYPAPAIGTGTDNESIR
ncbi:wax ester/triacylglycerol synthase domain-containing protein [Streptomyces sp. Wb2n-11]|uniref:wax ester/triacylglycerol synthase domain-containing protein n=1 Tax=Streptomyces sp. Wb2n-11 TaxID=1030533 RepID=UPI000B8A4A90